MLLLLRCLRGRGHRCGSVFEFGDATVLLFQASGLILDDLREGGKQFLTREQDEKLREMIRRSDSLNDAYTTVEDAPEERLRDEARRRILADLAIERDKTWEEVRNYKAELGREVKAEPESGAGRSCA